MNDFNSRLLALYEQLRLTDLVLTKVPTPDNMAEFARILNRAAAMNDYEKAQGDLLRFMYARNHSTFYAWLRGNNMNQYLLLTSGFPIVTMFNLGGLIDITWTEDQKFVLSLAIPGQDIRAGHDTELPQVARSPRRRGGRGNARRNGLNEPNGSNGSPHGRPDRSARSVRPESSERPRERMPHLERSAPTTRPARNARPERPEHSARSERRDRNTRPERSERPRAVPPLTRGEYDDIMSHTTSRSYADTLKTPKVLKPQPPPAEPHVPLDSTESAPLPPYVPGQPWDEE